MAAIGAPTNETAARPMVQGEAGAIEEQQQAVPTGPEQRGRPANPLTIEATPQQGTVPQNSGLISEVVPGRAAMPPAALRARPSSVEEQVGVAMLGLGTLTTVGRRLALALSGFPQEGLPQEVPPRDLYAPAAPEPLSYEPVGDAVPLSSEETQAEEAAAQEMAAGQVA